MRHKDVLCLKTDLEIEERMFPEWSMKVFDLNRAGATIPFAFREMLSALLESHRAIAEYTQPSVLRMLESGVDPISISPRRECVTVLYTDIIEFSRFAEHLAPAELIDLVNSHAEVCSKFIVQSEGQVNKLIGDGILAYFPGSLRTLRSKRRSRFSWRWLGGVRLRARRVGIATCMVALDLPTAWCSRGTWDPS